MSDDDVVMVPMPRAIVEWFAETPDYTSTIFSKRHALYRACCHALGRPAPRSAPHDPLPNECDELRRQVAARDDLVRFMDKLRDPDDGDGYVEFIVGSGVMITHDAWPDPFPALLAEIVGADDE